MPPRSVCLNVFTNALGNGKEADVSVREVEDQMEVDAKEEGRYDSVQGSPNDSIVATPYIESTPKTEADTSADASPIATTGFDLTSLPDSMGCVNSKPQTQPQYTALTCETCGQSSAEGTSLQRCSRCKHAHYCSKACQKHAWKTHKIECEPASSALNTPDISHPASPTNTSVPTMWKDETFVSSAANPSDPAIEESLRRYPQTTDAWMKRSNGGERVEISFGAESEHALCIHLANAYRLWRDEHGGPPTSGSNFVGEWRDYLDAVRERVHTPFPLDEKTKEDMVNDTLTGISGVQFSRPMSREELMEVHQKNLLIVKEFDLVNEAVYGVFVEHVAGTSRC